MGVANLVVLIHSFVLSVKVGPEPSEDPPVRGCQRESPERQQKSSFGTREQPQGGRGETHSATGELAQDALGQPGPASQTRVRGGRQRQVEVSPGAVGGSTGRP